MIENIYDWEIIFLCSRKYLGYEISVKEFFQWFKNLGLLELKGIARSKSYMNVGG